MDPNKEIIKLLNTDKAKIENDRVVLTDTYLKDNIEFDDDGTGFDPTYGSKCKGVEGPYRPFKHFKPVFIITDEKNKELSKNYLDIVEEGLEEILKLIGMEDIIPIQKIGYWHEGEGPHQSIEWYIERAFNSKRRIYDDVNGRGQCDIPKIYKDFSQDPIQKIRPHYDVLVLSNFDLFDSVDHSNLRYLIGVGYEENYQSKIFFSGIPPDMIGATVMSLLRFKHCDDEVIKTGVMHELGHTFGRFDHCGKVSDGQSGECLMKFPNIIPTDLEIQTDYRLKTSKLICSEHTPKKYELDIDNIHREKFPEVQRIYTEIYYRNPIVLKSINSGKLAQLETKLVLI